MLLPVLHHLSLDDGGGGDGNGDCCPPPSPSSLLSLRAEEIDWGRTKQSQFKGRVAPPDQARPDGGWIDLVWLGKGHSESVPEHLRAMSVMPKRATWPPWAPAPCRPA